MYASSLTTGLVALLLSSAPFTLAAQPGLVPFSCGTKTAAGDTLNVIKALHKQELGESIAGLPVALKNGVGGAQGRRAGSGRKNKDSKEKRQQRLTVDLYMHVVTTVVAQGEVSQQMIDDQVRALQNAYNPYSITFNYISTDVTVNDLWANDGDDLGMKASLRQGSYAALNIYYQTNLGDRNLGRCTLPGPEPFPRSANFFTDGCNVLSGTMPGGRVGGYNLGYTAVHEAGHWFGLLHTFEGQTCFGDGDFVADTPQQAQVTNGCPALGDQDSCPDEGGVDPVNNFMDYSYDFCYTEFTFGQDLRMVDLFTQFRSGS
ncbi:MAG: hypothetical protein M1817_004470 [Caeruleum heppii]|nr:MAG: hypothetical protein M1817_004470 [Caeruleum heppii]